MKKTFLLPVLLLAALLMTGCALLSPGGGRTVTLEGDQLDEALLYAQPKAEGLLQGLIEGDYEQFALDFDPTMKSGMDQTAFENLKETFSVKLGDYQSHSVQTVLQNNTYTFVIYQLVFEKDDAVTMRVVLDKNEPHLITGLWFDSLELRKN